MKTIIALIAASIFALAAGFEIAALGLALVAAVLLIGDMAGLPPCSHDCNQGRDCTCMQEYDGAEQ